MSDQVDVQELDPGSQPGAQPDQTEPAAAEAGPDVPALQRELAELKEKNLRLLADSRNAQQRAARERQEAIRYAESDFARELLVILDDLDRTLESGKSGGDLAAVLEGVRITQEHFQKLLRSRGIQPIEAVGRPFDPTYHEALMQQPAEQPVGTVIAEVARGYTMHERVLRPARVIVSGGPPQG